jgi:serine/threonine-protein kinase
MTGPGVPERLSAALKGRYRIEHEIGSGGMATVYAAHDVRHDRPVAVKVLKPELAAVMGGDRFVSEIRTTANLQHPHILQLYDSGEAGGFLYFVMPLVEGETLRGRIDREKQLPVDDAVRMAKAVAGALQAAHEQGVIHRDIKPANILLSHGEPLVADFGIALAVESAGGGRITETGLSLGTPYYMSPEQASADRTPDARSDIYSLGSVLYEMLCGEPPFTGSTAQAVLGKILTAAPPPPTQARRSIPPYVESVILKALERVPADRFATAADMARALSDPGFRHRPPVSTPEGTAPAEAADVAGLRRRVRILTAAAVGLAAASGWLLVRGGPGPASPRDLVEFYVAGDSTHEVSAGFPGSLALSPDGRTLAYVGSDSGSTRIYVRRLDERGARALPGTEGANSIFFSHDGAWLGYGTTEYDLLKVRLAGGTPTSLARMANTLTGGFWAEDGTLYYGVTGLPGLMRVSQDGGVPEEILAQTDSMTGVLDPWVLPGGDVVLATVLLGGSQLLAYDLRDGTTKLLGPGIAPRFLDGHLVYGTLEGVVLAQPFDPGRLEFTGDPVRLADGVGGWLNISRDFAASTSGALAFVAGQESLGEIVLTRYNPTENRVVASAPQLRTPRFSPDGDGVLYELSALGESELYVASLSQGTSRLVATGFEIRGASWSPDGGSIAYAGGLQDPSVWTLDLAGGGEPQTVFTGTNTVGAPEYTWDGSEIVVSVGPVPRSIVAIAADGSEAPRVVAGGQMDMTQVTTSPTGPWVAFTSDATGRAEVYITSLGAGQPIPVSNGGGWSPRWAPTGDTLFYFPQGAAQDLMAASLSFEDQLRVVSRSRHSTVAPLQEVSALPAQYDMHADGMVFSLASSRGDRIVVRTHFMPARD